MTGPVRGSMLIGVAVVHELGDRLVGAELPAAGERRRALRLVHDALTTNRILASTPCRFRGRRQS